MPVSLPDRLHTALDRSGVSRDAPIVVGVSGGVDSTVLWRLLHELGVPTVGVHVDYGLREASGADAGFIQAVGAELDVPVEIRCVALPEGNTQEAARQARYAAFAEVARASGAATVAVGHTADDQAETVLLHLVRGAGLAGLAGMPETRTLAEGVHLVRPLLRATHAEVEAEARARGWTWREDATNATDRYRRNRIRNRVMPVLEEEGGPEMALRIAAAAAAARAALGDVRQRLCRVATPLARGGAVPLDALRVLTSEERYALLAEALRLWVPEAPRSHAAVARVADLVEAEVGARVELGPADVWRERQKLAVVMRPEPWAGTEVHIGETIATPGGTLALTPLAPVGVRLLADPHHEVADAQALAGPLALRPWREGDRIQPLGMSGSRLVSDVLTDDRVPPHARRQRLVLASGDEILWVVGHRLAHAARVTERTHRAVSMTWTPEASHRPTGVLPREAS